LHNIRISAAGDISADSIPLLAPNLPDAARELLDSKHAKWGDKAKVIHHEHTPFVIDLARVVSYRPSAKRREIESKRFGFMPNNF
jgi:hypothetical protein